jgi:hypothetical protein
MKILQNFLEKDVFNNIKNILLSNNFPWYYSQITGNKNDYSDSFFYHFLFEDDQQKSPYFNKILMPIISKLNFNYLLRSKINFYTKKNKFIKTAFHLDYQEPHTVALFSINTNNGFTLFKKGNKIPSIENQLLIFDGQLEHCSVSQTDEKFRINININII